MALADYCPCAVCGGKAHYDAGSDYEMAGEVRALCAECAKDYRLVVAPAPPEGAAIKLCRFLQLATA